MVFLGPTPHHFVHRPCGKLDVGVIFHRTHEYVVSGNQLNARCSHTDVTQTIPMKSKKFSPHGQSSHGSAGATRYHSANPVERAQFSDGSPPSERLATSLGHDFPNLIPCIPKRDWKANCCSVTAKLAVFDSEVCSNAVLVNGPFNRRCRASSPDKVSPLAPLRYH